jgi:hypothetical protein
VVKQGIWSLILALICFWKNTFMEKNIHSAAPLPVRYTGVFIWMDGICFVSDRKKSGRFFNDPQWNFFPRGNMTVEAQPNF